MNWINQRVKNLKQIVYKHSRYFWKKSSTNELKYILTMHSSSVSGADPGFSKRGGGGTAMSGKGASFLGGVWRNAPPEIFENLKLK